MRLIRLVLAQPLPERGAEVIQEGAVSHYLRHVRRCRTGQWVALVDPHGQSRAARIVRLTGQQVRFQVFCPLPAAAPAGPAIHLVLPLLRGAQNETVLRMGTELGAAHFHPVITARCICHGSAQPRTTARQRRWQAIVAQAVAQCGRPDVPEVHGPVSLDDYLHQPSAADLRIVLWEQAEQQPLRTLLDDARPRVVDLLFGPEGGLQPDEVSRAAQAGFRVAWLGPDILRAETAPIAVLAIVRHALGGLG